MQVLWGQENQEVATLPISYSTLDVTFRPRPSWNHPGLQSNGLKVLNLTVWGNHRYQQEVIMIYQKMISLQTSSLTLPLHQLLLLPPTAQVHQNVLWVQLNFLLPNFPQCSRIIFRQVNCQLPIELYTLLTTKCYINVIIIICSYN